MYRLLVWPFVLFVSIGGFWFPKLGLLMYPMLVFIMVFGIFRGRYWCGNICPRGAFLDIPIKSLKGKNKKIPKLFHDGSFKVLALVLLMGFFIINTVKAFGHWNTFLFWDKLGAVGVNMCAITTALALILGFTIHHRAWCSFCPMGTVQSSLHRANTKRKKSKGKKIEKR